MSLGPVWATWDCFQQNKKGQRLYCEKFPIATRIRSKSRASEPASSWPMQPGTSPPSRHTPHPQTETLFTLLSASGLRLSCPSPLWTGPSLGYWLGSFFTSLGSLSWWPVTGSGAPSELHASGPLNTPPTEATLAQAPSLPPEDPVPRGCWVEGMALLNKWIWSTTLRPSDLHFPA